jgi:diguanylate cyclase (GGDEF)-like protein/PAS domain S-box-containing protein
MNIQLRPILSAMAGFVTVLLVIWGVNRWIVQPAFVELEQAQALEDGARARAAIQSELRQLNYILGNWAEWDDAFAFAANRDPAFIQSNLSDWGVLEKNSQLNLCVILDRQGQRLYSDGYDSDLGGAVLPIAFAGDPPTVWAMLRSGLEQEEARTGFWLTEHGLLLLAARPILTTQGAGPARGLLVFGRFLDESQRRALAEQAQVAFDLLPMDDPRLTADEQAFWQTLPANKPTLRPGPGGVLFAYEAILDLTGQPIVLLRTPVRQTISTTAQRTSRALIGTLGLAALILLLGQSWWCSRIREGKTTATASAWGAATLVALIGLTLTVGLRWELHRQNLLTPGDFSIELAGGAITLLLALYLFALVSQRWRAEALATVRTAELQASEDRFRRIVDHAPFGFHFYRLMPNDQLMFEGANPAADTILKFAHAPYVGQPLEAFLPGLASTEIPGIYRRLAHEGRTPIRKVVEYRDHHIAGSFEVIAFQTAPDAIAIAFTDVTERQRTQDRLRQSEEKFTKVFLTTPNAVVISRMQDGLLLDVNPGFEAITGYSRAEAVGRTTLELGLWVDPVDRDRLVADLRLYGQVLYRDFAFRRNDGKVRTGQLSARPLVVDDESCLLFVMQDITERQQVMVELQQRDRLLQGTADAMGLLLSGHDLDEAINRALATLGAAAAADRAYIIENHPDPATGALLLSQRYEWCAQSVVPQIDNPRLQNLPYEVFSQRWRHILAAGGAVKGLVRGFPDSERAVLEPQDIRSILVLPILLDGDFWGFIGFDDCHTDRIWMAVEENILRTAAAALGHAYVRQQAEAALRESEEQYRTLVDNLNIGVYRTTGTYGGWFLQANPAIMQMFGYDSELDFFQVKASDLCANKEERQSLITEILSQGQVTNRTLHLRRKDGATFWGSVTARAAYDPQGQIKWLDGVIEDITERRRTEARQQLAAAVFEAARESIIVTDIEGRIVAANPAFTTLSGYTEAEALGQNPRLLKSGRQSEAYYATVWQTLAQEGAWQGEFWNRRKDGELYLVLATISQVRDAAGRLAYYVGIATDLTQQKEAEQRIEHLAYYDTLTDLPNRTLLAQRAALALALAARRRETLTVLLLDLDRFKEVNDALGHAEGDTLLLQAAARLQTVIQTEDTVCRLGGDEFALLLPEVDQEGALRVTSQLMAAFRQPFNIAGHSLPVTVSIGIALYPHDGADFTELLKNADTALYRAKREGGNTWTFYTRQMNVATFERLVMEGELRQAIQTNQLRAYYQPKVRLSDRGMVGAEALVRWQHPERGLIPPGQFIPVAEASDLIVELGDWMLAEVCRQLAVWRRQGLPPLKVAVNLAARHFRRPRLADQVQDLLVVEGLPSSVLELELTESTLLEANAYTADTLKQLKQCGVGLALDDFGTGYSSLSYLKRLPLTALKIDQSFVRDLVIDADDRTLAATIVTLGHQMELEVVAEGVETEEQRQILLEQGCDLAQGYLFARPLPANEFATAWLAPAPQRLA